MSIRIVTDSTCDLSVEDCKKYDIEALPLTVKVNGREYLDGLELSREDFYNYLEHGDCLPTTSQVNPQRFLAAFSHHVQAGHEVIGLFISGGLSGTVQSARIARDMLPPEQAERVHVIDSRSASMSLALLLVEAAKMRDKALAAQDICHKLAELISRVRFFVVLDTLKYVRMGGRISATTAVLGELMGIKPIVTLVDGVATSVGKARGIPAALMQVLQNIKNDPPDLSYGVALAHASAPKLLQHAKELFQKTLDIKDAIICEAGPVIGTYAGRGAHGISYIAQND